MFPGDASVPVGIDCADIPAHSGFGPLIAYLPLMPLSRAISGFSPRKLRQLTSVCILELLGPPVEPPGGALAPFASNSPTLLIHSRPSCSTFDRVLRGLLPALPPEGLRQLFPPKDPRLSSRDRLRILPGAVPA